MLKRLLNIWIKPRLAARSAIESSGNLEIFIIMSLFGMAEYMEMAIEGFGEHFSTGMIYLQIIVGGPLVGILTVYLLSFLTKITGKFLKGKSDYHSLRKVIAYSFVPSSIIIILNNTLFVALLGEEVFLKGGPDLNSINPFGFGLMIGILPFALLLLVWILVISSKCVGEAQGFSAAKGFLNIIMATFLLVIGAVILAVPLSLVGLTTMMF